TTSRDSLPSAIAKRETSVLNPQAPEHRHWGNVSVEEIMKSVTKKLLAGTVIGAAIVAGSASALVAQEKPVIATVVKISGIPWFDRMNTGVEAYQKANPDVVATQSGPATADAAQQLQIVQDLVAKGVNAL